MKVKKNKGFTLVEVIVVLVILAILAAIAIPALTGYIDKAKDKEVETQFARIQTAIKAAAAEVDLTKCQEVLIIPPEMQQPTNQDESLKFEQLIRSYLDPDVAGKYYIALRNPDFSTDVEDILSQSTLGYYPNGGKAKPYYLWHNGEINRYE